MDGEEDKVAEVALSGEDGRHLDRRQRRVKRLESNGVLARMAALNFSQREIVRLMVL